MSETASGEPTHILTLSCADRPGIVARVAGEIAAFGGNIAESAQFWDRGPNRFFMRIAFTAPAGLDRESILTRLAPAAAEFGLNLEVTDLARRPRILILVSKFDHCLEHLLYQIRVGWLRAEVAGIVSNHEDAAIIAVRAGLPFHHWPVNKATKARQEGLIEQLIDAETPDLIVLARYMQVMSDAFSARHFGKAINIHHSFLPSFKGAKPYHQAHDRGVKLIGATAHYVTGELDEGPIIEQETERVGHAQSPEDLVATGRDIESRVLARAVKLHLERRVLLNGRKTVVFRD